MSNKRRKKRTCYAKENAHVSRGYLAARPKDCRVQYERLGLVFNEKVMFSKDSKEERLLLPSPISGERKVLNGPKSNFIGFWHVPPSP